MFTLAVQALVPGYRHEIVICSDTGYSKDRSTMHLVLEYKVDTLCPDTGSVPEFWSECLAKCAFTLVPSENRT